MMQARAEPTTCISGRPQKLTNLAEFDRLPPTSSSSCCERNEANEAWPALRDVVQWRRECKMPLAMRSPTPLFPPLFWLPIEHQHERLHITTRSLAGIPKGVRIYRYMKGGPAGAFLVAATQAAAQSRKATDRLNGYLCLRIRLC